MIIGVTKSNLRRLKALRQKGWMYVAPVIWHPRYAVEFTSTDLSVVLSKAEAYERRHSRNRVELRDPSGAVKARAKTLVSAHRMTRKSGKAALSVSKPRRPFLRPKTRRPVRLMQPEHIFNVAIGDKGFERKVVGSKHAGALFAKLTKQIERAGSGFIRIQQRRGVDPVWHELMETTYDGRRWHTQHREPSYHPYWGSWGAFAS